MSAEGEYTGFREGLAHVYNDGIFVREGIGDVEVSPNHIPPEGLTWEDLKRFEDLVQQERRISARRAQLHARIDFVKAQEASSEDQRQTRLLDHLMLREREVSQARRELHRQIDELRTSTDRTTGLPAREGGG